MLHTFITDNHPELLLRCREKESKRVPTPLPPSAIDQGVPLFLRQLATTLRQEELHPTGASIGPVPAPSPSEIGRGAALHGTDMLQRGFSVDQVVHNYGDVCQAITELAVERKEKISAGEFRTLNRCLDDAIADAVTAFGHARQIQLNDQADSLHDSLNLFADEQHRLIDIAIDSFAAIKTGNVGMTGATGTLLVQALEELRALADRTVPELRLASAKGTLLPP